MTTTDGIDGLDRIGQVKLPVSDLAAGVAWYCALLDLRLWAEFVEDGVLRGAGLIDPRGRFAIALRDVTVCAGPPHLAGFDVVAFLPADESVLEALAGRCERLGVGYRRGTTPDGAMLDVADPDGTVLRFYAFTGATTGFTGIESRDGEFTGTYDTPRLRVPSPTR